MKLRLKIHGQQKNMEIGSPGEDCHFRYDDAEHTADVAIVRPGVYSILIGGRSYDASLERDEDHLSIAIRGSHIEVEISDPRQWSPKTAPAGHGIATLVSPMPGKVVRVLVTAGDRVEAGQGILVVEAMKMQNEIKTPKSGIVLSLAAREGATVTAGAALATIE
jgi:biotin carboxyl carrier protein